MRTLKPLAKHFIRLLAEEKKQGASSFATPLFSVSPVVTSLIPRVASVSASQSRSLSNLVHRVCLQMAWT